MAFTCGGKPILVAPYTQIGKVSTCPETKLVMRKSSSERTNARRKPHPGAPSG
jgi:hypothetical protein